MDGWRPPRNLDSRRDAPHGLIEYALVLALVGVLLFIMFSAVHGNVGAVFGNP